MKQKMTKILLVNPSIYDFAAYDSEVCHFIEQKKTSKSNFSDGEIFFDV